MLNDLGRTLNISRTGSGEIRPGSPISARLEPPASELSVTGTVTGAQSVALSVVFAVKNVVFKDASFEESLTKDALKSDADQPAAKILRGVPIPDPAGALGGTISGILDGTLSGMLSERLGGGLAGPVRVPLSGMLTEQAGHVIGAIENAPGILGQLDIKLPAVPVQVPVNMSVEWTVLDGTVVPPRPMAEGTEFFAPDGLTSPAATFIILPQIGRESTSNPLLPPARRIIRAEVTLSTTLSTGSVASAPRIIDLDVFVPSISIPTILALFRHPNFAARVEAGNLPGVVLLVIPPDSPLTSFTQVLTALRALRAAIGPLAAFSTPILSFAGFLLGLDSLINALDAPQFIMLIEASTSLARMDAIPVERGFFNILGFEVLPLNAEDRFDSLIFIGRSGDSAHLFNIVSFDTSAGDFTITARQEMFVMIRDLRSASPAHEPLHTPTDDVFAPGNLPDGRLHARTRDPADLGHHVTTFGHEISSLTLTLAP
jgi:hypothetical protein